MGGKILIEEVPVDAIDEGLATLPLTAMNSTKPSHTASRHLTLPLQRLANATSKAMLMAKADLPEQGFVLDHVTITTSTLNNYTFQGDTTYYINGHITLTGTTPPLKAVRCSSMTRLNT